MRRPGDRRSRRRRRAISTPFGFGWLNITVDLLCSCVLGLLSVKLTGIITPTSAPAEVDEVVDAPAR